MKKKKVYFYVIIMVAMYIVMAGDWSRKEPKHLAVGTSYLYDIAEDGGVKITVEYLSVPSGGPSANEGDKFIILQHEGKTDSVAVKDDQMTVSKEVFAAHNRVRFFSEKFARKGLLKSLDFFTRGYVTDERPFMIVVKNEDPNLIYKADKIFCDRLGDYVHEMGEKRNKMTLYTSFIHTMDFIVDYYTEGQQCVMGVVEVKPNPVILDEEPDDNKPKKYYMSFEGLAVFREDKLAGYLDGEDVASYKFLVDKIKDAKIVFDVDGKYISATIRKSSANMKVVIKNQKPTVEVTINNRLMISENDSDYDVNDKDDLKLVEDKMNKYLEQKLTASIRKVQTELKSDIYGFGKNIHMQKPKEWKKYRDNWDELYFPDLEVTVKVNNRVYFDGQSLEKFGKKSVRQRSF